TGIPLWTLLLLCLFVPGRCDCQRDCLSCGRLLPEEQSYSALVCLIECKEKASPALTWDLCRQFRDLSRLRSLSAEGAVLKKGVDQLPALSPVDLEEGEQLFSEALQRFHHVARALGADRSVSGREGDVELESPEEGDTEDWDEEDKVADGESDGAGISLSKRFGGFLKGKYGYRKLMGPGRPLQKRYGGFIGIRKSARKWHNQKRFSEFLRQYLGMSTLTTDVTRQNEM
uniref:Prepronociceptin a n=1 Tax=Scleropages formosus TaxID=113540 RepID=A0A8C9R017_SCLFO